MTRRPGHIRAIRAGLLALCATGSLTAMMAPDPVEPRVDKPAVMVLYFDNNTGNASLGRLSKGLADMLITDLSTVQGITVVERERLEALMRELNLQRSSYFNPQTAQRLGRGVGAAYAVTGAFISVDPEIRIDVRVIRVETGVVVKSATVTGRQSAFFALQRDLVTRLVEGLPETLSAADLEKVRASTEANRLDSLGAAVEYGNALSARDSGDVEGASRRLQRVVNANPAFTLGQTRYRQAMQELMAARRKRAGALSAGEALLLQHIDERSTLPQDGRNPNFPVALPYRYLLLQYHASRLAQAERTSASGYRALLEPFIASGAAFIDATGAYCAVVDSAGTWLGKRCSSGLPSHWDIEEADEDLAERLGIDRPGDPRLFLRTLPDAMIEIGKTLILTGRAVPIERDLLDFRDPPRVCYYQVDPSIAPIAVRYFEDALRLIDGAEDDEDKGRATLRALQAYARALHQLGRSEEAIARLQAGLDRYPADEEFDDTEELLLTILENRRERDRCAVLPP